MAWQRLKHAEIPGSAGVLDSGTFTAYKHLRVIIFGNVVSGTMAITFNGVTPADQRYPYKTGDDGATKTGANDGSAIPVTDNANPSYVIVEIWNVAGEEKQIIARSISSSTGAGTAPDRREILAKWTETTNQITSVKVTNTSGGSLNCAVGSYITVLGEVGDIPTEDEKTTLTNVQAGTRFEAIDTKKFYRRTSPATLTISEDFSSDGWTHEDTSISGGVFNFDCDQGSVNTSHHSYKALGQTLSDSKWIMRCKLTLNNLSCSGNPDGTGLWLMLCDTSNSDSGVDSLGFSVIIGHSSGFAPYFRLTGGNNTHPRTNLHGGTAGLSHTVTCLLYTSDAADE